MDEKIVRRELEFGQTYKGNHYSLFCYDRIPAGLVPAETTALFEGNRVMYKVEVGPDKGKYYDCIVSSTNHKMLMNKLVRKKEVYVKGYKTSRGGTLK